MDLRLDERLKGMETGRAQLQANRVRLDAEINAFNGAIEMLKELIADRDKPEPKEAANG